MPNSDLSMPPTKTIIQGSHTENNRQARDKWPSHMKPARQRDVVERNTTVHRNTQHQTRRNSRNTSGASYSADLIDGVKQTQEHT